MKNIRGIGRQKGGPCRSLKFQLHGTARCKVRAKNRSKTVRGAERLWLPWRAVRPSG